MIFYKVKTNAYKEFRYSPKVSVLKTKYKRFKSSGTYQEFLQGLNFLVSGELVSARRYSNLLHETTCLSSYFDGPLEVELSDTYICFGARFLNSDCDER